ncbi:MAG: ACT domain-containing protein, partial [Dehalococcoidales bacterium]|nr:ACT domain-containing protein [Dehalococcoidales bacterium]
RFSVVDQAGVLARITDIFWKYNISIAAVIQKESAAKEFVPVVVTTYLAKEDDVRAAIEKVDKLEVVKAGTKIIRLLSSGM